MDPHRMGKQTFRRCCARFATGVTVATVLDDSGEPHGVTVNSFTSVSLSPPQILICLDHSSRILRLFRKSAHFGVSVLREDQQDHSTRFAMRGADRFQGVPFRAGKEGVPLIEGAIAFFACRVAQVVDSGDHAIFIAEVIDASWTEGRPLLYYESRYHRLQ